MAYTPFIERNIGKIAAAIDDSQQKKLAQGAYMGDQSAMSELAGVNPQLAQQIQQGKMRDDQVKLHKAALDKQTQEEHAAKVKGIAANIAKFDNFEEAKAYAAQAAQEAGIAAPPLDQSHFDQFKKIYGDNISKLDQAKLDVQKRSIDNRGDISPYQQEQIDIANRRLDQQSQVNDARIQKLESPQLKPLPVMVNKGIIENTQAVQKIDQALDLLDKAPNSTGMKGYLPNVALNRMYPEGTETRAIISDIGSLKLHDRSGAAVSASESPRLMPFIPLATDDAVTAKKKLGLFKQEYLREQEAINQAYSKDQGYTPSPLLSQQPTQSPQKTGGVMHVDAAGNKAIVYPDGSFEEVQ